MGATTTQLVGQGALAQAAPAVRRSRATEIGCRALDIVVAATLLFLLAPLLLVIAAVIRADSPGWVIFRQRRIGRDLEPFMVAKFRTMRADAGEDTHQAYVLALLEGHDGAPSAEPMRKLIGDVRVTRVGGLLRRTSLDELPQLWNVLRGDMSLVGPRPPIPYEVEHYRPEWFGRFAVKPGVTGLWQVNGRSQRTVEEMMQLDVSYVERRTLRLNLWILLRTVPVVLSCRGAG
jgi:lipopolysaccharide/colanic/teichoic acid biosynthesis glycosyltransferase